ncbi:MAG TPA: hypothetical protein VER96_26140 [Polyangiaceae bacterium]|nr:hypothetical protein [Polyangiaceae bacterium]
MTSKLGCLSVIGGLLLSGCVGSQQAQMYSMKDGSTATLVLDSPSASAGSVSGKLASGANCRGSFSTLDPANAKKLASPEMVFTENASASVAVLSCDSGTVLRCTLARRTGEAFSYGECRDQGGTQYSMVF